jgi:hypothetical protein
MLFDKTSPLDVRYFGVAVYNADHYLMVEKVRERLIKSLDNTKV